MTPTDSSLIPSAGTAPVTGPARKGLLRAVLWGIVVASTLTNMVASSSEAPMWVLIACGTATVFGSTALGVSHLRSSRQ
ncbi:hypothetical protein BJY27_001148 [Streptomyces rapamycinicus]|uniref:Uncharacterized protein n=2 Tax=Streptomyces rapamycinicus TaxID=1226757 RepID=A0A3L8R6Z1_STRRN|nr:hypothetical protein [Streptomyces rapamycinicus]RLV75158.1 hypothetical protein D3C57_138070 [Streptomyces rapamycinicus NRRL 5491]